MSDDKLFKEYGYGHKSPMELVEEFAVKMMLGHGIHVTEINFGDNGIDKFQLAVKPTERVQINRRLARMRSSVGRIKLGAAEEES